jgi:O-antigen ligase
MNISERADISATAAAIDESSMDRLYAWRAALNMALARPLNGVGLSNFSDSIYFYADHWANFRDMVAHSTWFTVLAETGFPGFVVFMLMVATIYTSANRSSRIMALHDAPAIMRAMTLGLTAALAGFCAAGTFLTQTFTWPIYILLALTVAMRRIADDIALKAQIRSSNAGPMSHGTAPESAA